MSAMFYYITILNLFDAVLTWFGLSNAFMSELNPLMNALYEIHPTLFLASKAVLSICLLLFILFKKIPQSAFIKSLTFLTAVSYTIVVVIHGLWLVPLF